MALQDGYEDRGPQMIAIYWVEAAIAIVVVSLRVWGRITIRQVGLDDYVMIFTLVSARPQSSLKPISSL